MKFESFLILLALLGWATMGCGSPSYDVAPVSGVVTLDGDPLPNAIVYFFPETGRPASGETDQEGRYRLNYKAGLSGTPPGSYLVKITTAVSLMDDTKKKELVPAQYNTNSELKAEVKPETNVIDFALTTD